MGKGSGRGGSSASTSGLRGGHAAPLVLAPLQVDTSATPYQSSSHYHHYPTQPQHHDQQKQYWPKGLKNVGNTCYANAVLQCLMSTALTHALLDPRSVAIFRRYSSNPSLLEQGSGSVDSEEEQQQLLLPDLPTTAAVANVPANSDVDSSKERSRRKEQFDRKMHENCQWLTRELKKITREYHNEPNAAPPSSWFGTATPPPQRVVNPASITLQPDRLSQCLRPYQQEDAHEFLRALLSTLVMNGQNRQLSALFDGLLESAVTCTTCWRPSLMRDRYMDLSLDITSPHVETLNDALSEFTKTETLTGDNKVFCAKCQSKRTATKGLRLATAPSILVCHLKRFAFDSFGRLNRLHKLVRFPLRLEIGDFMSRVNKSRPPPYDLVAVLVHEGRSCDCGHYLSYVKCSGDWFRCNDAEVERVTVETVLAQQAYILVYEVAEMREKHGYPSPNQSRSSFRVKDDASHYSAAAAAAAAATAPPPSRHRTNGTFDFGLSTLMCGLDESMRDFCYNMASCEDACRQGLRGARRTSSTNDNYNIHAHSDIGLEELSTMAEAAAATAGDTATAPAAAVATPDTTATFTALPAASALRPQQHQYLGKNVIAVGPPVGSSSSSNNNNQQFRRSTSSSNLLDKTYAPGRNTIGGAISPPTSPVRPRRNSFANNSDPGTTADVTVPPEKRQWSSERLTVAVNARSRGELPPRVGGARGSRHRRSKSTDGRASYKKLHADI